MTFEQKSMTYTYKTGSKDKLKLVLIFNLMFDSVLFNIFSGKYIRGNALIIQECSFSFILLQQ